MIRKPIFVLLAVTVAGLSGCATMSGDECVTSDWSTIGFEDGAQGYTTAQLANHRKACAKHGVTPDSLAYQNGRDRGLLEYCQPGRGFSVGSNGSAYNGVCDVALEADFLHAYHAGHRLHKLRSAVSRANASIGSKEHELEEIEDDILLNGVSLVAEDTSKADRILLLADVKNMAERTGQLEAEIKDLYEIRAITQLELDEHYRVVADMGY